jgi:MFS family permease
MEPKEKLWNSEYIKVMIANFSLFFAFYLLTPLLPIYLSEHFHASKDIIGLVLSGYVVTALFFRPFSGYVVDTFNRKKVLILCFFVYSVFFAGYLLAS